MDRVRWAVPLLVLLAGWRVPRRRAVAELAATFVGEEPVCAGRHAAAAAVARLRPRKQGWRGAQQ
ncbi:MAG: hypothetical protein U1E53_10150 [Dongiaceae bacterium]